MHEYVQRGADTWTQLQDGTWVKWNVDRGVWEPQPGGPPPPSPPAPPLLQPAATPVTAARPGAPQSLARAPSVRRSPLLIAGAVAAVAAIAGAAFWFVRDEGGAPAGQPAIAAAPVERSEKEAFIEQANALCAKMNAQLRRLSQPTSLEEIPGYVRTTMQITKRTVHEIKQLDIPKEDRALLNKMFAAVDRGVQLSEEITAAALPGGDPTTIQGYAERMQDIGQKANGLALKYGLVTCAEPV